MLKQMEEPVEWTSKVREGPGLPDVIVLPEGEPARVDAI